MAIKPNKVLIEEINDTSKNESRVTSNEGTQVRTNAQSTDRVDTDKHTINYLFYHFRKEVYLIFYISYTLGVY